MTKGDIVHISVVFSIAITLSAGQYDIIEISLPNAGNVGATSRIRKYQSVLDISSNQYIRFAVKARNNAHLLFSEKPASNISSNTDEFIEIGIGEYSNSKSKIGLWNIMENPGEKSWTTVRTANILDSSNYEYFWVSWSDHEIKIGHGLLIGTDVFLQESYSPTLVIKHLALCNTWGSAGQWKLFIGRFITFNLHTLVEKYMYNKGFGVFLPQRPSGHKNNMMDSYKNNMMGIVDRKKHPTT